MILHNNADVPFTREELSRRESVSAEMENVWLSAMFETDGFAVTPTLGLEAGNVTLTRGVAVGSVNGSRRLIIIPPQRLPYPAVQGNYTLYVKPEAWVDLHPSLGVSGGAIYLDSASYAYASGQLAADTGLIQMIGVVITVPEAAADNWLPLAAVTVPADAPPMFVALAADDPFFANGGFGLIESWRTAKRPVEFHLFEQGGHGFGMYQKPTTSTGWFEEFSRWLDMHGLLKRRG